jgi:hypothetical protein
MLLDSASHTRLTRMKPQYVQCNRERTIQNNSIVTFNKFYVIKLTA